MHLRRHLALLLSMAALGSTGARASEIQCTTTRQTVLPEPALLARDAYRGRHTC
jgi:hypothetical protein